MASFSVLGLVSQTRAIVKKNLRLLLLRNWISTLLQAAIIPILIIALTLNIQNFTASKIVTPGPPAPIKSLRESVPASKYLVFATRPGLGPDVDEAISRITAPLAGVNVIRQNDPDNLPPQCSPTFHGVSACFAVVEFNDSPLSKVYNGTWNYTIRVDQSLSYDDAAIERTQLPLQLAVNNAITNSTTVPYTSWFMTESVDVQERERRKQDSMNAGAIFAIAYFLAMLIPIYHVATTVTAERASGMSLLIDSMGGSPAGRVLGSMITFGILYLPFWIVSGALYWATLFRSSNAAIFIFWQILSGWATTSSTVFAAAFFKGTRISAIFIAGSFLALAGGGMILLGRYWIPLENVRAIPLSLFFPSMNYMFMLFHLTRFGLAIRDVDMTTGRVALPADVAGDGVNERYDISAGTFLVFSVLQIVLYPVLAIVAEHLVHGVNFKGRQIVDATGTSSAVEVTGLTKIYKVSWWKKAFCCWRPTAEVRALDGLDLVAQKRQILCLLGVNGAGKSTTLDLLSGFTRPSSGAMTIASSGAPLGICPQKNIMRNELTVLEHVNFWSEIKSGKRDAHEVDAIIIKCGLEQKKHCRAGKLSGGQKRKLQLACMFVGGSTVCFMDEVTTGLDPLSRRTMWDIILAERAKRSIIFTTHFLDEGDVLADHIVILSKGQIKCQGTGAELKTHFGGGYRVHLPQTDSLAALDFPTESHQDRVIYRTEDSKSAARLVTGLESAGHKGVQMAGPTIEDVFLNVTREDVPSDAEESSGLPNHGTSGKQLSAGHGTSFWSQVAVLLRKRLTILPRYWMSTLLALVLPLVCVPAINGLVSQDLIAGGRPTCEPVGVMEAWDEPLELSPYYFTSSEYSYLSPHPAMPVGPRSANESLYTVLRDYPIGVESFNISQYDEQFAMVDDMGRFQRYIDVNKQDLQYGGFYMGDEETSPILASQNGIGDRTTILLNLWSQVRSKVPISVVNGVMNASYYGGSNFGAWIYVIYACFILAVYPCFFALYPAFEKTKQIRALQYSNGVRPLPMWTAYFLFDFCFVLVVSMAFSATVASQFGNIWWLPMYMLPLLILYGITGILISYIISLKAPSQLSAFLWTLGYMMVSFVALALAYTIPQANNDMEHVQRTIDIVSFTLGLIFPIGNMYRAMGVGLNIFRLACRNDNLVKDPSSIWGYGLPILYLCFQVMALPFILIWADNDLSISPAAIRRVFTRGRKRTSNNFIELLPTAPGGDKEAPHVRATHTDLLQLSHLTKSFSPSAPPAVDDISLSLGQSEILALLGPNGAGKTTIVNMIRGLLTPDSGTISINGADLCLDPHLASRSLGVCPQFDALDLLTARQHLEFYARIKGVASPRVQADILMAKVGLTPHASRLASRLSGGNKRKLSLAIALTGNPDVLVLDEPSSAMDAAAKRQMWKVLADIAPGRSLLLTTHSMEEADALATRAAILAGKMLAQGTTQELRERYANLYHVHLVLRSAPGSSDQEMEGVEGWVKAQFGHVNFEGQSLGGQVKFMVPGGRDGGIGKVVRVLEEQREAVGIAEYSIGAPTLERVFLSVVRDVQVGEEDEMHKKRGIWGRFKK